MERGAGSDGHAQFFGACMRFDIWHLGQKHCNQLCRRPILINYVRSRYYLNSNSLLNCQDDHARSANRTHPRIHTLTHTYTHIYRHLELGMRAQCKDHWATFVCGRQLLFELVCLISLWGTPSSQPLPRPVTCCLVLLPLLPHAASHVSWATSKSLKGDQEICTLISSSKTNYRELL